MHIHCFHPVKKHLLQARYIVLIMASSFLSIKESYGQADLCNRITKEMNYTVRSVKIDARWVSKELQAKVEDMIGVGNLFDPAKVDPAIGLVKTDINNNEASYSIRLVGSTSALYVTAFSCPLNDTARKEVEVIIKPYYLRIDLYNIGNNILPIPRTARPALYKQVPSLLLATSPMITLFNDSRFGTSFTFQTKTDLLHMGNIKKENDSSTANHLDLDLNLQRSFTEPYHDLQGSLQFIHSNYSDKGIGWAIGIKYAFLNQPMLVNENKANQLNIFASLNGSAKNALLNKYLVGAGLMFSENNYNLLSNKFEKNEMVYGLNVVTDGRIGKAFSRLAVWFNAAVPKKSDSPGYQRLAASFGYAVALGKKHNVPELEVIAGMGYTWKKPLPYNEFFAGNSKAAFLYASLESFNNTAFPVGPNIRSLGTRTGGVAGLNTLSGGTSFWGLNINFSIPVSRWAKPLIPDVLISDEPHITMRSAIKGQVNTAMNSIAEDLAENQGLSDDEADAAAERIVQKDIKPALYYLADRANIYSIKPLIFFDIGAIYNRNTSSRLWVAPGIGLQVCIVNAKLQIGYIHTVIPKIDADKGNFILKFSVQDIF